MRILLSPPPAVVRALQIAVLIGLAFLLWRASDGWETVALLQDADPRWLIAAALALTLQTLLSAQRWRITAAQLGLVISPAQAVREYYLAQVVNQSLPGGVVGDAGRAVRARGQAGLLLSGQAVIFERLAGQIGLFAVLVVGLALSVILPVGFDWPAWLYQPLSISLVVMALLGAGLFLSLRSSNLSNHAYGRFLKAFAHAVAARDVLAQQIGLSLGTAVCNVLAFAFCAAAIGIALPVLVVATLVPLILFAMVLPFSIGGWGFREGAAVLLFPVIGATASEGLATSIAFGVIFLMAIVPGLLLSWLRPIAPVLGPP